LTPNGNKSAVAARGCSKLQPRCRCIENSLVIAQSVRTNRLTLA
jgi:hypothetical protein